MTVSDSSEPQLRDPSWFVVVPRLALAPYKHTNTQDNMAGYLHYEPLATVGAVNHVMGN